MILSRYLIREVMTALSAVMAVLLLVFLSQQVVRYLNYVALGKIPTNILFTLVGFEIPYLAALLLPLALYLGILIVFGRAYAEREMAVMTLSGYREMQLLRLTFVIALMVAGAILYLMLWVNPAISMKRQHLLEGDGGGVSHLIQTLMPGRFQASSDGRQVIYAEQLSRDHQHAENVFIARTVVILNGASLREGSPANTRRSFVAKNAPQDDTAQTRFVAKNAPQDDTAQTRFTVVRAHQGHQLWDKATHALFFMTTDGYRYDGSPGQNDYRIIQFKKYAVRIPQQKVQITHMADEAMTTTALWHDYADPKRAAELQWRFSIGLSALLLALLATLLSAMQSRYGRYLMLLPSILIYIIYINLLFVARHWLEQGRVPITIGMWWAHGIILLFILFIQLNKTKQWMGRFSW